MCRFESYPGHFNFPIVKESVNAIIFNSLKDKVLIIKRRDVPVWVFPGGGLDPHEIPENAIIREVLEETGLKVAIHRKVAVYTPINRLTSKTHLYECLVVDGNPITGDETAAIGFFPLNNLPSSFFHIHQSMLRDCLNHLGSVLEKPLDNVTYWELIKYFVKHPLLVLRFVLSQFGFPLNSKE